MEVEQVHDLCYPSPGNLVFVSNLAHRERRFIFQSPLPVKSKVDRMTDFRDGRLFFVDHHSRFDILMRKWEGMDNVGPGAPSGARNADYEGKGEGSSDLTPTRGAIRLETL